MADALIPYDIDAEEALLGACMLSREAITAATSAGLEPADFYRPQHGLIYTAILNAHTAGEFPDPTVLANRLNGSGSQVGGDAGARHELLRIQSATPASANAPAYARIVEDHSRRRRLMEAAGQLAEVARDGGDAAQSLARLTLLTTPATPSAGLAPVDLAPILAGAPPTARPTLWVRTDGVPLIYPGMLTTFQTEPGGAKTWLALHACAEQLHAGKHVVFIDLEADPGTMVERLRAISVPDQLIGEFFHYIRPDGPFTATDRLTLIDLTASMAAPILVIDTLAAILAMHGLNEDKAPDVLAFLVPVARPLARTGAAILLLDHVTKDKDTRGRWARGSGGKLGEMDVAFNVNTVVPFSRYQSGHVRLKIAKDRYGSIGTEGDTAADIYIHVRDAGKAVSIRVAAPDDNTTNDDGDFTPTQCMEAVSIFMENIAIPVSQNQIVTGVTGYRKNVIVTAINQLARDALIRVARGGPGKPTLHHLVTPYRHPTTEPNPPTTPETEPPDYEPEMDF